MKKIYIFDTNVILSNGHCIMNYGNNDIVIPIAIFEELDHFKSRMDSVGSNARQFIRSVEQLRKEQKNRNLYVTGLKIGKGLGSLYSYPIEIDKYIPADLQTTKIDNYLLATAMQLKELFPDKHIIVVSKDINVRVKCSILNIETEDYSAENVVADTSSIYSGYKEILVDDQIIENIYHDVPTSLEKDLYPGLYPNQFILLISNQNEKKTSLARFINYNTELKKSGTYKNGIFGINPKNKEQTFALDLLLDNNIKLVTISGKAGSGKTLLTLAAALHSCGIVPNGNNKNSGQYNKIVISRPVMPMGGKDLGFMPGDLLEKMNIWLSPIRDNLEYLVGDTDTLDAYIKKGTIEIECLSYIRGRSISNAYMIIDETQNLNHNDMLTILTRVGENTKVVLTGDIFQIDHTYIDAASNGLTYVIEKFKDQQIAGHITLKKGERSELATLASKIL